MILPFGEYPVGMVVGIGAVLLAGRSGWGVAPGPYLPLLSRFELAMGSKPILSSRCHFMHGVGVTTVLER